ncbi:MAG: N-acetyl sugar amidotransferase [Betaproteobacteria bacterium]|nr:N-acetyl sugar amidotransferase [Betaproteobacteria bacterium]
MRYCKRCVNPDTRPNIFFDEEGICLPCRHAEAKANETINWSARQREIEEIARWGKMHAYHGYDCIVTVSGGKDSTRQALHARDELGLKPLLVSCVYPPEQLAERGAHNLANLIELGFDTISLSLNPQVWKELMLKGFMRYANWCKSTEMALYAIPIHAAIAWQIPLVFYGENPSFTIGERTSGYDGSANNLKQGNTIASGIDNLATGIASDQDLHFYRYPSIEDMELAELRLVYLGYYIPNFNQYENARIAMANGLEIRHDPPETIGDINGYTALDEDFVVVNQLIKYIKYGYGRVTDQVVEGINTGLFDRVQGIELVQQYDGKCDLTYIRRYCNYLGIAEETFWKVVESQRGQDIWIKNPEGDWQLRIDINQT